MDFQLFYTNNKISHVIVDPTSKYNVGIV